MEARDRLRNLVQVLDWLATSPTRGARLDQRGALRAILDSLVSRKIRVYGRCCAWNDGHLKRENEYGLISPGWLSNAEFISGPKGREWFLVPWGCEPFTKPKRVSRPGSSQSLGTATVRFKYDQFGNCVAVPFGQIDGYCELQFPRDEVMALWPPHRKHKGKGGRHPSPLRKNVRVKLAAFREHRGDAWVKRQTNGQLAKAILEQMPAVKDVARQTLGDWIADWRSEENLENL